ncbi:MAG: MTH1187 family thiamine-binding protein, partial [Candidatus Hadarchaeales archaeon]
MKEAGAMAIMEISVVPVGTGSTSISDFVVEALKILRRRRLRYRLTPMGTIVEGGLDELLSLVREVHEAVISAGAKRLVTCIKI